MVHPEVAREARLLGDLQQRDGAAVLYHLAIESPAEEVFLALGGRRKGVVYHNITPARHFVGVSRTNFDRVRRARRRLPLLAASSSIGIALSEFSRLDLIDAGFTRTAVCPLAVEVAGRPPPRTPADPPVVLGVGRVAPHKRWELAIRAVGVLRQTHPRARLDLVGSAEEMEPYASALVRLAAWLNVPLRLTGRVDDARLEAAYAESAALILPSAHEGLGLPLLEAMARGIPVVATADAAIPETVGGAGLLCPADPLVLGESLRVVVDDRRLAAELGALGRRRAAAFDTSRLRTSLGAACDEWDSDA